MGNDPKMTPPAAAPSAPISRDELLALLKANNEALMVGVVGLMQAPAASAAEAAKKALASAQDGLETCGECRQLVKACGKKHRKVVVLPKNARDAQWFQGYFLNGVRYLSNHGGHAITVPEASNPEAAIEAFEEQEDVNRNGRVNLRNSGGLGLGEKGASIAWGGFAR